MDGWIHGWMGGWVGMCVYGCMQACIYATTPAVRCAVFFLIPCLFHSLISVVTETRHPPRRAEASACSGRKTPWARRTLLPRGGSSRYVCVAPSFHDAVPCPAPDPRCDLHRHNSPPPQRFPQRSPPPQVREETGHKHASTRGGCMKGMLSVRDRGPARML